MGKLKKLLILTVGIIMLWGSMLYVQASGFQFNIMLEEKQIKPGDTIRVDMQVSNIDVTEGINVVEANLEYDENVFESVTFVDMNRWSITYNDEVGDRRGKFVASKLVEGVTKEEKIGQIQLKLKSDAKEQETEIKINHITSNDGTKLMDEGSRIIKVKIKEIPNNGQNGSQIGGQTGGQNSFQDPIQIIRGSDKGTKDGGGTQSILGDNLKTGDSVVFIILVAILLIAINVGYFIHKERQLKEEGKEKDRRKIIVLMVVSILFMVLVVFLAKGVTAFKEKNVEEIIETLESENDDNPDSTQYLVTDKVICRVKPDTTIEEFIGKVEKVTVHTQGKVSKIINSLENQEGTIAPNLKEVKNKQEIVKTGMVAQYEPNGKTYEISVLGDLNQDGMLDQIELTREIREYIKSENWRIENKLELLSADITGDGKINEDDINSMVNYIVYGRFNRNQQSQEKQIVPVKGPKIEVVSGIEGVQGRYISNVTVKISQEKQEAKVAKTIYTIMGTKTTEEIEIDEEEQIELTQAGVYKITSYNYGVEGNKSKGSYKIIVIEQPPEIKVDNEGWTCENVVVTLEGSDKYNMQYKINEGEWIRYDQEFEVEENATITTRVEKDGQYGIENKREITNIERQKPTGNIQVTGKGTSNIALTVEGQDKEFSGMKEIRVYAKEKTETEYACKEIFNYEVNEGNQEDSQEQEPNKQEKTKYDKKEESLLLKGLKAATQYDIYIEVEDLAGNILNRNNEEATQNTSITVMTDETPLPVIVIDPIAWTNEKVQVTVEGEEGYKIEYKINNGEWIAFTEPFEVEENTTIVARLIEQENEINIGKEVTKNIDNIDKILPTGNVIVGNITANKIELNIQAQDSTLSGLREIRVYTKENEPTAQYQCIQTYTYQDETIKNTLVKEKCEISSLKETTSYEIYVEIEDIAGNILKLGDSGTGDQPGGDKIVIETKKIGVPIITVAPIDTWTNQDVIATVTMPEGYQSEDYKVEYILSKGEVTDQTQGWKTYDPNNKIKVPENTTVYAKIVDEHNEGDIVSKQVTNIDKINPTVGIEKVETKANQIKVKVQAQDEKLSGMRMIKIYVKEVMDDAAGTYNCVKTYEYGINENEYDLKEETYTIEGLKPDTSYKIYVEAIDKAGNFYTSLGTGTGIGGSGTEGDDKLDINIDTDGDGKPDINIDIDGDGKPDINIDIDGDGKPDINIDIDGDGKPDINIDTDGDGKPDINIDLDGDGKPDIYIDTDGDGKPDTNIGNNIDTDGDGKPDINIDTDGDGKPDINIDIDGDGKPDINIDTDGDGKPDINIDPDGDGEPDINIDTDGDGKPDINIDIDGDGKPDINIDPDGPLDIKTNVTAKVSIKAEPTTWTNRDVIATMTVPEGHGIEYMVSTEEITEDSQGWTIYDGNQLVIEDNATIYARATKGENHGEITKKVIANIDKKIPIGSVEKLDVTPNRIQVKVKGQDKELSGIHTMKLFVKEASQTEYDCAKIYQYANNQQKNELKEEVYTMDNLPERSTYLFYVEVEDKVGITYSTKNNPITITTLRDENLRIETSTTDWINKNVTATIVMPEGYQEEGYQAEYILSKQPVTQATTGWKTYDTENKIIVEENTTIYARMLKGDMKGNILTQEIGNIDKMVPAGKIQKVETGANNIKVKVQGQDDKLSGIHTMKIFVREMTAEIAQCVKTYEYGSEAEEYDLKEEIYTIEGLQPEKSYRIYLEVKDKAGNIYSSLKSTSGSGSEEPGDGTGTEGPDVDDDNTIDVITNIEANVTIEATPTNWINDNVTATLVAPEQYAIEYMVSTEEVTEDTTGWLTYHRGSTITVENNATIYARVTNGTNHGGITVQSITNIDKVDPTGKIEKIEARPTAVKLKVQGQDAQLSGIHTMKIYLKEATQAQYNCIKTYEYEQNQEKNDLKEEIYTIEGLNLETNYQVYVEVEDKVGNRYTTEQNPLVVKTLKEPDLAIETTTTDWTRENMMATINMPEGYQEEGYEVEYILSKEEVTQETEGWIRYDAQNKITIQENTTIYARPVQGDRKEKITPKIIHNIDKETPSGSIAELEVRSNQVKFNVTGQDDKLSGIHTIKIFAKEKAQTEYSCKKTYEYGQNEEDHDLKSEIYTMEALTADTIYEVYVEAIDKAGNIFSTEEQPLEVKTLKNPDLTITTSTDDWTKDNVTATITMPEGYEEAGYHVQYILSKEEVTQETVGWTNYSKGSNITIEQNTTIYARAVKDEIKENITSKSIANIDKLKPNTFRPVANYNYLELKDASDTVKAKYKFGNATITSVNGVATITSVIVNGTEYSANDLVSANTNLANMIIYNATNFTERGYYMFLARGSSANNVMLDHSEAWIYLGEEYTIQTDTTNKIVVTASASDAVDATGDNATSGIAGYRFKINNQDWTEYQEGETYEFLNLEQATNYIIIVEAKDRAGNTRTATVSIDTGEVPEIANAKFSYTPNTVTDEDVKVEITTDNAGYVIQYKTEKTGQSGEVADWTEYTGPITLTRNQDIYARIADSSGQISSTETIATGTISNIDKLEPIITSSKTTTTTNSITVEAEATDQEATDDYVCSGNIQYRFSIDDGTSWTDYQESGTKSFGNLTQNQDYAIKIQAKDGAGKGNVATIKTNAKTEKLSDPTIKYSTTNWTSQNVTVTIEGEEGYTIEYYTSLTGQSGEAQTWTETTTGTVTLTRNQNIYVRLTDGTNTSKEITGTITNIDKLEPVSFTPTVTTDGKQTGDLRYYYDSFGTKETYNYLPNATFAIEEFGGGQKGLVLTTIEGQDGRVWHAKSLFQNGYTNNVLKHALGESFIVFYSGTEGNYYGYYRFKNYTNSNSVAHNYSYVLTNGIYVSGHQTNEWEYLGTSLPVTNGYKIKVTGATSDNGNSGIAKYYFRRDNGSWYGGTTNPTYTFTGIQAGSHTFQMKAEDYAGNSVTTQEIPITVGKEMELKDAPDKYKMYHKFAEATSLDGKYITEVVWCNHYQPFYSYHFTDNDDGILTNMIIYNNIRTATTMPGYYQFISTQSNSTTNREIDNTNAWRYLGPTYKVYGE